MAQYTGVLPLAKGGALQLSPMDITYKKWKAIKSQILPDFTAEWLEL
jgi:hypothetical protein